MQKLKRYKSVLDGIIDIGKTLGDAFAWIFYQHNRPLLKKHYEHEFIPRLPTRLGGRGEVNFIRNHQMFGRYFVLSHSIATFLREGDVSLIDPNSLQVAAIGELKTQRINKTLATTRIFFLGGRKLPKYMLPKMSKKSKPKLDLSQILDPETVNRLKRQVQGIKKVFLQSTPNAAPEKLRMNLACSKLEKLFNKSSENIWGQVRVGRGLLLIGIKFEDSSLVSWVTKQPANEGDEVYKKNLERMRMGAREIVNKNLADNGCKIDWMLYRPKKRYQLQFRMRPLFWWPLSMEVREALIFKRMAVMTLYNPAFLINALRHIGFDVQFKKEGSIEISKKNSAIFLKLVGVNYLYEMIQTNLFSEETIITMIQKFVEGVEKANIKQATYVDLDSDFVFQEI